MGAHSLFHNFSSEGLLWKLGWLRFRLVSWWQDCWQSSTFWWKEHRVWLLFHEKKEGNMEESPEGVQSIGQSDAADPVLTAVHLASEMRQDTEVINVEPMEEEEKELESLQMQFGEIEQASLSAASEGYVYPSPTEVASQSAFDVWKLIEGDAEHELPVSRLEILKDTGAAPVGDKAVQACKASIAPAVPQFFWETDPFLKMVFGGSGSAGSDVPLPTAGLKRPLPPIEIQDAAEERPVEKALRAGAVPPLPLHSRALKAISIEDTQSRRAAVIGEWAAMVALNINAFSVGRMLEADKKAVVHQDIVESVTACLAAKATSTLVKRMCAMSLFCKWCLANGM